MYLPSLGVLRTRILYNIDDLQILIPVQDEIRRTQLASWHVASKA